MKKLFSLVLSVVLLISCFSVSTQAVSLKKGTAALDREFKDGVCSNGIDYVYYSPAKKTDSKKYPLLIWLHGMKSGKEKRAQLEWYEISNWASDEYQAKFKSSGGCFIFAPRASNSVLNNWDASQLIFLKGAIDEFVSANKKNIDMNRIYIAGYSTGAVMVWDMLGAYPNYFAAALPASAIAQPAVTTLTKLKNVSVWLFCCDRDCYALGKTESASVTFSVLGSISERPADVRMTSVTEAVFANYEKKSEWVNGKLKISADAEHYTWEAITHDMHMDDGKVYAYSTTVDALGRTIDFSDGSGVVSWLSQQKKNSGEDSEKTGILAKIRQLFERLVSFIKSLLF